MNLEEFGREYKKMHWLSLSFSLLMFAPGQQFQVCFLQCSVVNLVLMQKLSLGSRHKQSCLVWREDERLWFYFLSSPLPLHYCEEFLEAWLVNHRFRSCWTWFLPPADVLVMSMAVWKQYWFIPQEICCIASNLLKWCKTDRENYTKIFDLE